MFVLEGGWKLTRRRVLEDELELANAGEVVRGTVALTATDRGGGAVTEQLNHHLALVPLSGKVKGSPVVLEEKHVGVARVVGKRNLGKKAIKI